MQSSGAPADNKDFANVAMALDLAFIDSIPKSLMQSLTLGAAARAILSCGQKRAKDQ